MSKLTYIDDCRLDHFILEKILSRFGSSYEVKCTDTGNEVLNLLQQEKVNYDKFPDLILLDIYTPALDAWDFLDKVESIYPALNHMLEVYILSAFKYPEDMERLREYSCVKAFILKPITKEVLQKLIRHKIAPMNQFATIEAQN
jgi:CheY-like chemotaxis protein